MQNDLRLRIRKLCTEAIIRKVLMRPESSTIPQSSAHETLGLDSSNLTVNKNPTIPALDIIDAESFIEQFEELSDMHTCDAKSISARTTRLDKIIYNLRTDVWHSDLMLLITPTLEVSEQYKLYVLDRSRNCQFLGATNINNDLLSELKSSKALQEYCVVLTTDYVELNSNNKRTNFIRSLLNTITDNNARRISSKLIHEHDNNSDYIELNSLQKASSHALNRGSDYGKRAMFYSKKNRSKNVLLSGLQTPAVRLEDINLMELIQRINTAYEPTDLDLDVFFNLAEFYEFKIYIRPELCWKNGPATDDPDDFPNLARFSVECFMIFDNYVGGISLDGELLQQKLHEHPQLLRQVQVVTDVYEITPLPRPVIKCLRTVCDWLGMEILYDAFGELVFDLYKHYVRA